LECLTDLSKINHHTHFVRYFVGPRSQGELPVVVATERRRAFDMVVNFSPRQLCDFCDKP